jgi:hypothetical protein
MVRETRGQRMVRENLEARRDLHQEWPVSLISHRIIIGVCYTVGIIALYLILFYAIL